MTRFDDLEYVAEGICPVGMTKKVKKQFDKWKADVRAGFAPLLQTYARERSVNLNETQFVQETRLKPKATHKAFMICAFKQFAHRLYGIDIDGQFIITDCDGSKKQDKADPIKLQGAADKLVPYLKALKEV